VTTIPDDDGGHSEIWHGTVDSAMDTLPDIYPEAVANIQQHTVREHPSIDVNHYDLF